MRLQDTSVRSRRAVPGLWEHLRGIWEDLRGFLCFSLGVHSPAGPWAGEDPVQGEQHRVKEAAAALPGFPCQPPWTCLHCGKLAISSFALLFSPLKKLLCERSALPSSAQFTL